jgi:hypothetical protein
MKKLINKIGLGNVIAFVWLGIIPFCIYLYFGFFKSGFNDPLNLHTIFGIFSLIYLVIGVGLGILGSLILIVLIGEGIEKLNNRKL